MAVRDAVQDRLSGHSFLVDTGAKVSVLLSTHLDRRQNMTSAPLQAAIGSIISTFVLCSLTLDLPKQTLRWIFTVAFVTHPILGSNCRFSTFPFMYDIVVSLTSLHHLL